MNSANDTARRPWAAVAFALCSTGLGHIYCGRIAKGLVLFLASLLFAPLAILTTLLPAASIVLVGLIGSFLAVLGVYLYATVDAWRIARTIGDGYQLREFNRGIVYVLFALVGITYPVGVVQYLRAHVVEAFLIPTASEAPNILPGDRVLVNRMAFQHRQPQRGEVVVFRHPTERDQNWIKRVIGLSGDTVAIRGNDVYVNGELLKHEAEQTDPNPAGASSGRVFFETSGHKRYRVLIYDKAASATSGFETKVPAGCCFLLGDNRDRSRDSREIGCVPLGDIFGLVQYIYLPADRWSRFGVIGN